MEIILIPFLILLSSLIGIYVWVVIASVLMSWLISFGVVNTNNNFVLMIVEFLYKVTEPLLMRIRRFLPIIGGVDLSPFILILFLWFFQGILAQIIVRMTLGNGV